MSTTVGPGTAATGLAAVTTGLDASLAAVSVAAAGLTLLVPDVLLGTAVMNGSARGTAAGVLGAAAVLAVGLRLTRAGHPAAPVLRLAATWYLLYNAVLLTFATPFNRLFLLYVAMLGLAVAATAWEMAPRPAGERYRPHGRMRLTAAYIAVIVAMNTLVWLSRIVPALVSGDPEFLDGTGLTTNPVFVQDLAFWLPLAALVAWLLWRGTPTGGLWAGALLVFWLMESLGVALDQWLGHRADPSSAVASEGAVWLFLGSAAVGLVVLVLYFRALLRPSRT